MHRAVRAVAIITLVLTLAAPTARTQPVAPDPAGLRGESGQTRKRLIEAEQKLNAGKAGAAADDLQRILDEAADDLIVVSLDGRQLRPARAVVHQLLAKLPPDALRAYQTRIDAPAQRLLAQAKKTRDPQPLWQLLDRYFVARPADAALLLLGELLFERGDFHAAERVWRRLLPDAGADVIYPGSKADPALVRARIVLAVIFQHDTPRAKAECAAFQAKHPGAKGTLAGKTGPLADTLQTYLAAPPKLAPDPTAGSEWSTFGGGPDRAGRVPGGIPNAWPARPSWRAEVPQERGAFRAGANDPPARPPFGHPVIVDGEVFVADGTHVYGFDLRTGDRTRSYSPFDLNFGRAGRTVDAHCTLTAASGRLYARLGPAVVRSPEVLPNSKLLEQSLLVCLSPRLKELWRLAPPAAPKVAAAWEGAPLVSERRLWAVYARFEGGRAIHVAACYDPADGETAPVRPVWTAELCDSPQPVAGTGRARQELLTLAGRHLVFCSNGGAVVAVEAATGKRAWAFRYARSRKALNNPHGDPAPAVAFNGRVYVAPADADRVYALDAESGQLVWESGTADGAQIVGVARRRLIVSVAGPLRSIRGLNLDTGSYRDGGWIQGSGGGILGYGQGIVTDDVIVWPSREGLFFLNPSDGRPARGAPNPFLAPNFNALKGYFGNIAYADGVLVIVTPTEVWGYRAQSRKIVPAPETPPRARFDILTDDAERKLAAGDATGARAILAEAAGGDLPPDFRAWCAARLLQLTPPGEVKRLPAGVQTALRSAILAEWVLAPDGVPVTLEAFLKRHLGTSPAPGSVPAVAVPDFQPCASPLTADSDIDRTLKLPPGVAPLRFIPGAVVPPKRLYAAGPQQVLAVPLDRGAKSVYTPADQFSHAADLGDGFVAAGPFAVAVYGVARDPLWVFRMPRTDPLPDSAPAFRLLGGEEPSPPHLSSFVLAGSWLFARVGEYHLIALDLSARRVAWVLGATGRTGYEPAQFPRAVQFGEHFAICGKFAVVQLSDGRRWFVELVSGRVVPRPALGTRTARVWWPLAPAVVNANRLLVADGPGLVRLLDTGGRVKWAFEVEHADGLTGDPAQVRGWDEVLLVAIRRNHGVEIERVDMSDGTSAWVRGPAFADTDRIDLSAADADVDRVYIPAANKLLALNLTTGKTAWEAELPDAHAAGGWVVRSGKSCVIAYPANAIPAAPTVAVWARLVRSFRAAPHVWRLPALAATLYDAWMDRVVPVLLFDPVTGKQLRRFDVPARGPAVTAWLDANVAVIATGDRVVWLK